MNINFEGKVALITGTFYIYIWLIEISVEFSCSLNYTFNRFFRSVPFSPPPPPPPPPKKKISVKPLVL